jgi:branched-chain amino acid transport system substrate-binding protein
MKRKWIAIVVIIIAALVIMLVVMQTEQRQGEIKVGAILTLSGDAAGYGQSAKDAIELGIKEINDGNSLAGLNISLIYEDDQLDPKTGVSAFRKLVEVNRVSAVIGPLTSSVALAIAPVANEKKIVLLSPSASSPSITEAGDYIFRNVASDEFESRVMAQYAYDSLKLRKIGIIHINNDFGVGYRDFFTKYFRDKGGEISATEVYEQGSSDFRTQLTKLKASSAEAIYVIGYKEMGKVLRQAQELGIDAQFLSYSAIEDPDIISQAGNSADGVIYSRQSFDPNDPAGIVRKFSTSFRKVYNRSPDAYAALSYDSIMIMANAIANGGPTSEGIKRALYDTQDFPGVTGKTSFDTNGDVTKSISIKQIQNGTFHYLVEEYFLP